MKKTLHIFCIAALAVAVLSPSVRADANAIKKRAVAREYITACYQDILERQPTQEEQDQWMAVIVQKNAGAVRKMIAASPEAVAKIKQVVQKERGVAPTQKEILAIQKKLASGGSIIQLKHKLRKGKR